MALSKTIMIDSLGVNAVYWRIDSVFSDRRRKITTIQLSGYLDDRIALSALSDSSIRPLDQKTIHLPATRDPLLQNDLNTISFAYTEIKALPEWSDATDV